MRAARGLGVFASNASQVTETAQKRKGGLGEGGIEGVTGSRARLVDSAISPEKARFQGHMRGGRAHHR